MGLFNGPWPSKCYLLRGIFYLHDLKFLLNSIKEQESFLQPTNKMSFIWVVLISQMGSGISFSGNCKDVPTPPHPRSK